MEPEWANLDCHTIIIYGLNCVTSKAAEVTTLNWTVFEQRSHKVIYQKFTKILRRRGEMSTQRHKACNSKKVVVISKQGGNGCIIWIILSVELCFDHPKRLRKVKYSIYYWSYVWIVYWFLQHYELELEKRTIKKEKLH